MKLAGGIALTAGCSDITYSFAEVTEPRLFSRPNPLTPRLLDAGLHNATVGPTQLIAYVPASALARTQIPLALLLHGSARDAAQLVDAHREFADRDGVVVLAPYASRGTWDAINQTFGPDLQGIDRALAWLFDRLPISMSHMAVTGFSDGATYSLALGRANGDLFSRIVAYSPGFLIDVVTTGRPPIAISHGTHDEELPYAKTRDVLVPALRSAGYNVDFRTFEGTHQVLMELVGETLDGLAVAE